MSDLCQVYKTPHDVWNIHKRHISIAFVAGEHNLPLLFTVRLTLATERHLTCHPQTLSSIRSLSDFDWFVHCYPELGRTTCKLQSELLKSFDLLHVISEVFPVQGSNPITAAASIGFLQALLSALLMNICIVGINQVYDVEIDRINKPYLPLATGELMQPEAAWIVSSTGAASIALGLASASMPLVGTLVGSLTLGIAYSTDLPYLRWKRFPLAAAACILSVR